MSNIESSRDRNPDRRASSMIIARIIGATSSGTYMDFVRQFSHKILTKSFVIKSVFLI